MTPFCLFFLAFKQAEFTLHPDFHETWVPENSLQPWALPQSEPLLHDICICSSISLPLLVLPGGCPLDRYCMNVTWSTCRKLLILLYIQILKLESATVESGKIISHLRKGDRKTKGYRSTIAKLDLQELKLNTDTCSPGNMHKENNCWGRHTRFKRNKALKASLQAHPYPIHTQPQIVISISVLENYGMQQCTLSMCLPSYWTSYSPGGSRWYHYLC